MSVFDLWGQSFDCECGYRHRILTEHFTYGSDALERLGEAARDFAADPDYLLIADQRTYEAAGAAVGEHLKRAGARVRPYIVPDGKHGESPQTDDRTMEAILKSAPGCGALIAVGSGVVNDLTKWAAFERKRPFFTMATAASMNGYASANVSALRDGLKVLFQAEAPKGVFALPEVIENAPFELTASGLGDVVAKPVSSADWKLNRFLFGEYYCQTTVDLISALEPVYFDHPEKIAARDPKAIQALFEALVLSGVAMTLAGTSAPASGGEHLISHTMDMVSDARGQRHDFHGRQVGVTTVLSAALYQKVLELETPAFRMPTAEIDQAFWGPLSEVVRPAYRKKAPKYESSIRTLNQGGRWDDLRSTLSGFLRSPDRIKQCLKRAGAAHQVRDIRINGRGLGAREFMDFWKNAHQMRERFTILDLALMTGILPERMEEILEETALV